jgi:excisionase family DNA binding protein
LIHDGVELPKLLTVERAADVLGVDTSTVRAWIADRSVSAMRVNGVLHVLTASIADRLGEETPSRPNRESL